MTNWSRELSKTIAVYMRGDLKARMKIIVHVNQVDCPFYVFFPENNSLEEVYVLIKALHSFSPQYVNISRPQTTFVKWKEAAAFFVLIIHQSSPLCMEDTVTRQKSRKILKAMLKH